MTADVLSGGRVIAGVGVGWMREEFEALGTPPYAERGAVTDEYLRAWRTLWTEQRPTLDGKYAKFDNVMFAPKPASKPHLPIWVGGESPPALRRTVKYRRRLVSGVEQPEDPAEHAGAAAEGHRRAASRGGEGRAAIQRRSMSAICGSRRPYGTAAAGSRARGSCSAAVRRTCWRTQPRWRGRGAACDLLSATPDDRGDAGGDPALRGRSGTQGMMNDIETAPLA